MADRKLARVVALKDGAELRTIGDAAAVIEERFSTTKKWGALEDTLVMLRQAAESGKHEDIQNATDALVRVLDHSRLLGPIDEQC